MNMFKQCMRAPSRRDIDDGGSVASFELQPNPAWASAEPPLLSVVIPFYQTEAVPLARALLAQIDRLDGAVELLLADDGSPDRRYGRRVLAELAAAAPPAALLSASRNVGRASIRNALARTARGRYLLFVDCDLAPGDGDFIARWVALAAADEADIVYGGFRMRPDAAAADGLHAYYSARSDCLPAEKRQLEAAKYTYTNNLLVARHVVAAEPFDERFTGWGWEDVEWALRAGERWAIRHVENPVLNAADGSAQSLLRKFAESVGNFALLWRLHPAAVRTFPIFRASRIMALLPLLPALLPLFEIVALDVHEIFPMQMRYLALKLYRAGLYGTVHDTDQA